jgi:hypothetical protein
MELERDMKLMGCTAIGQLSRDNLRFQVSDRNPRSSRNDPIVALAQRQDGMPMFDPANLPAQVSWPAEVSFGS